MRINEVAKMATEITAEDAKEGLARGCRGFHESLVRSYHIVNKVKELLEKKTDPEVVLELIALMESDEFMPYAYYEWKMDQDKGGNAMGSLIYVGAYSVATVVLYIAEHVSQGIAAARNARDKAPPARLPRYRRGLRSGVRSVRIAGLSVPRA